MSNPMQTEHAMEYRVRPPSKTDIIQAIYATVAPPPEHLRGLSQAERDHIENEIVRGIVDALAHTKSPPSRQLVKQAITYTKRPRRARGPRKVRAKCPTCGAPVPGTQVDRDKPPSPDSVRHWLENEKPWKLGGQP